MSCMSEELQEEADPVAQPGCKGFAPVKEITGEGALDKSHYVKFSCWCWLNFGSLYLK